MGKRPFTRTDGQARLAVAACTGVGIAVLLPAVPARADLDDVFDQLFSPFVDAATSGVDWDAFTDATAWST
ncbi:hypothetical protein, partial [Mycobacterium sp. UM_Kg1]|uniref:hypothetical protein n=1 Tax=Mycobacterium sp. UM_Kg1 TaxID=1545691 RepID=UPI000B022A5C